MKNKMLAFKNVSFHYKGENNLLENLNFEINQGDFVALIGQSGCGKSTIFRLILDFEKVTKGEIEIHRENIAFMPQKDMLFPWRSIEENLGLPLEIQGYKKNEIQEKVQQILEEMNLLDTKDKYPSELSGGMRQRISFARTVLTGADLLLLDEPFSALDYFTRLDFQEWIMEQYTRLNKTIFFITHSVEEAILLSNRIFVFEDSPLSKFEEVRLDMPYPRSHDILNNENLIEIKTHLVHKLRKIED